MKFFIVMALLMSFAHAETECQKKIQKEILAQARIDFPHQEIKVVAPDTLAQEGGAWWQMYDVSVVDARDTRHVIAVYSVGVDEVCGLSLQPGHH